MRKNGWKYNDDTKIHVIPGLTRDPALRASARIYKDLDPA